METLPKKEPVPDLLQLQVDDREHRQLEKEKKKSEQGFSSPSSSATQNLTDLSNAQLYAKEERDTGGHMREEPQPKIMKFKKSDSNNHNNNTHFQREHEEVAQILLSLRPASSSHFQPSSNPPPFMNQNGPPDSAIQMSHSPHTLPPGPYYTPCGFPGRTLPGVPCFPGVLGVCFPFQPSFGRPEIQVSYTVESKSNVEDEKHGGDSTEIVSKPYEQAECSLKIKTMSRHETTSLSPDSRRPKNEETHKILESFQSFPCDHPGCDHVAKRKGDLNRHRNSHTLSTLYPCRSGCENRTFTNVNVRRIHERDFHRSEEDLLICRYCPNEAPYKSQQRYMDHLIKMHKLHADEAKKAVLDEEKRIEEARRIRVMELSASPTFRVDPIYNDCAVPPLHAWSLPSSPTPMDKA